MDAIIKSYIEKLQDYNLIMPAWYDDRKIVMLNQLKLPKEEYIELRTPEEIAQAIKDMVIRGSGAIALAGIYGVLIEVFNSKGKLDRLEAIGNLLISTRPTAVNMHKTVSNLITSLKGLKPDEALVEVQKLSVDIMEKQLEVERQIGKNGAKLISDGETIMTICHAGGVAGFGFGGRTLSIFRTAVEQGKDISVISCETRPYFQGARITAWELKKFGIPVKLISDNMAGAIIQKNLVNRIITGSDRIALNGDTANKIGTYLLALAAHDNNIPFHISTSKYNVEPRNRTGKEIEIEFRNGSEVLYIDGKNISVEGVEALYPGFDITPNRYITSIITEAGVFTPPYEKKLFEISRDI
ncbi:S-methyl-5-thioribose-1-phosphate isomerase [Tepidimicrobium xylanilyticum]|uniref:S-methyl-5-thioribose-1-phosphate isomerase n=1 Tax=Tepidimicrobium xylanilyticum TaxID=1123352 RepID=UPI00264E666B|nr:S-methyl-5-thioribose-1-phosphate isomerase [Tepidimicrobium xylanilyticum]GMG95631.1 methylthioribose-1-phosphate isomerase [Tepidimicrobium xylanilyticum]